LFLSATDALHCVLAEALLLHIDSKNFEAFSASASREPLHPILLEVMGEIGLDLTQKIPGTIESFHDEFFDFVITLDEVTKDKQYSLTATDTVHWKFENPLAASNNPEVQRRAARSVRDQIARRLRLFDIVHVRPQTQTAWHKNSVEVSLSTS